MATLNDIEVPSSLSGTYKELQLQSEGWWFLKPRSPNFVITGKLSNGATSNISQNGNGLKVFVKQADIPLSIFLQADCEENSTIIVDYSDSFFDDGALGGSSGGGGGGGITYTFNAPLVNQSSNISIALSQSLKITQDRLDLNLNANPDFKNALLGIDEAKKIATYTSVGRVMPKEHHFQLNALSGELELDLSPTGVLSQGFTPKQDFTTLDSEAVKITNIPQDIDGAKNFVKELSALAVQLKQNSANGGGVDIHSENGYFSISKDNQGAYQLLAGLGFIDNTTSFRIRNLNGGIVTFNTLAQYEGTFTPTDDKDLVHLAYVKQVKADLMALIQQAQGGLTLIGTIPNTKAEVEANYTLLDNFVQTEAGRPKQKGDFIITSDRWGFVYNGTNWVNFGQVSIVIATTTQAGLMMFGTNAGELEDIGGGKAKVIGWDTITQALTDLDRRISANATNIQQIQTSLTDYARLPGNNAFTGDNTFSGNNTFTTLLNGRSIQLSSNIGTATGATSNLGSIDISGSNRFLSFSETLSGNITRTAMIGRDASTGGKLRIYNQYPKAGGGGNESIVVNVPIEMPVNYSPTQDFEVANKKYVDDTISPISQLANQNQSNIQGITTRLQTAEGNITQITQDIQTNYKKAVIIPVGGSLPTQTASDTIYYIEV